MTNRVPRWAYGCLALLCALLVGASLGVFLFAYGGDHLFLVPSTARVASYLIGLLCALVGALCIVAFARHPRATPPHARRRHDPTDPEAIAATPEGERRHAGEPG